MTTKIAYFHIPQDQELLAAFGEVALRHEHMNHILKMTIKSLADLTPAEAIAATKYDGSGQLRERIRKIARKKLGEGAPLLKLQAILVEFERVTGKRNELVHGLWAVRASAQSSGQAAKGDHRGDAQARCHRSGHTQVRQALRSNVTSRLTRITVSTE